MDVATVEITELEPTVAAAPPAPIVIGYTVSGDKDVVAVNNPPAPPPPPLLDAPALPPPPPATIRYSTVYLVVLLC
jgi:hypothetical protein